MDVYTYIVVRKAAVLSSLFIYIELFCKLVSQRSMASKYWTAFLSHLLRSLYYVFVGVYVWRYHLLVVEAEKLTTSLTASTVIYPLSFSMPPHTGWQFVFLATQNLLLPDLRTVVHFAFVLFSLFLSFECVARGIALLVFLAELQSTVSHSRVCLLRDVLLNDWDGALFFIKDFPLLLVRWVYRSFLFGKYN